MKIEIDGPEHGTLKVSLRQQKEGVAVCVRRGNGIKTDVVNFTEPGEAIIHWDVLESLGLAPRRYM